jgi:ankyrin repeat protein
MYIAGQDHNTNACYWTGTNESVDYGHADIVDMLIKAKDNINATNNDGYTALKLANEEGYSYIAALLKKAGAKWRGALIFIFSTSLIYFE